MWSKKIDVALKGLFAVLLIGLIWSKFLLSATQFFLIGLIFIFSWSRQAFFKALKEQLFWILTSLYFFHLIGILWTNDLNYAWKDIRIKLPLLTMPIIFASYRAWIKERKNYFLLFFGIVVFSYMMYSASIAIYLKQPLRDILLLSHIRFSLMISFSFAIFMYYAYEKFSKKYFILFILLGAFLFATYLFFLASFTGYWSFLFVSFLLLIYFFFKKQKKYFFLSGLIFFFFGFYLVKEIVYVKKTCFPTYGFFTVDTPRENGHPTYENLEAETIISAWNKRSIHTISSSTDSLFHTLVRYLASKGLPGNDQGVLMLTSSDVHNIENGMSNHLIPSFNYTQKRLYEIFWEWYAYLFGKEYTGHSFTQRLKLWEVGLTIFKNHWIFGVGTGDIQQEFVLLSQTGQLHFLHNKILRTHQQYISIAIQLGIIGLLLLILLTFYPLICAIKQKDILFIIFALLLIISMLYEDTLESQVGVSFFAIFTSFFSYQTCSKT